MKRKLNWKGDCYVTANSIKHEIRIYIHQNEINEVWINSAADINDCKECELWTKEDWHEYFKHNEFNIKQL